jgi:AcrR family transcriptional regulator
MSKGRWEEIVTVSASLFSKKDYRSTTLANIAAELNVTQAALYFYIKSKHDILYAICKTAINQYKDGVEEIFKTDKKPEEKLRDIIFFNVNLYTKSGDIINVYLSEESELPPAQRRYIRKTTKEIDNKIRDLFYQAIEEETFREMNVLVTTRAIFGMCNWLSRWYKTDGECSADEVAQTFVDLIMTGCLKADNSRGKKAKAPKAKGKR